MTHWFPYDTWYEVGFCKELAKKLRKEGDYLGVRLGSYIHENGKVYCKIFVLRAD